MHLVLHFAAVSVARDRDTKRNPAFLRERSRCVVPDGPDPTSSLLGAGARHLPVRLGRRHGLDASHPVAARLRRSASLGQVRHAGRERRIDLSASDGSSARLRRELNRGQYHQQCDS